MANLEQIALGQGDFTSHVDAITSEEKSSYECSSKLQFLQMEAFSMICYFTMVEKHMGFQLVENSLFL